MQIKGDPRWKHAGGSTAVTAGKKSSCLSTVLSIGIFLSLGSQCVRPRTSLFHVDDDLENNVKDN